MEPIKPSEHVGVFGITGGGKTFCAETYLPGLAPVVKLDTKGEVLQAIRDQKHPWQGVPPDKLGIALCFDDLVRMDMKKRPYIIYAPGGKWALGWNKEDEEDETDDLFGLLSVFFRWFYETFRFTKGGCRLWIDELKDVVEGPHKIDRFLKYCYTKGRFFDIGVWALSQEPRHLPSLTMSQVTHTFAFDLPRVEDRKRIADYTGCPEFLELPTGYNFWYHRRGWREAVKAIIT